MLFRGHCLFYMIGKFSKLPYHTKSPPGGMHTRTNGKYRLIREEEITNIHLKKYLYKRFALWYNVKIKERDFNF